MDRRIVVQPVLPDEMGPGIWRWVRRACSMAGNRHHNYFALLFRSECGQSFRLIGEWHGLATDPEGNELSPTTGERLVAVWHSLGTLPLNRREEYCYADGSMQPLFMRAPILDVVICEGSRERLVDGMLHAVQKAGALFNARLAAFEPEFQNSNGFAYSTAQFWGLDCGPWSRADDAGFLPEGPIRRRGRASDYLRHPQRAVAMDEGTAAFTDAWSINLIDLVLGALAGIVQRLIPGLAGRALANAVWAVGLSIAVVLSILAAIMQWRW